MRIAVLNGFSINGITINGIKGGRGFPLLLLHRYPQTHQMWPKIAPRLAANFTVIATDLRGYGDSDQPLPLEDSSNYCKRVMVLDQVLLMEKLGYQEFYLIDRPRSRGASLPPSCL